MSLCVFLFLARALLAQGNSLDKPALGFHSSNLGLTETLLNFANQQNLQIAIEYVDRDSLDRSIAVSLQGKTVRESFDTILRNGRGYSWQLRNGVIEIRNKRGSKRADKLLDTVVPLYEIHEGTSAHVASAMLWIALQAQVNPAQSGFAVSIGGGAEASQVKPAMLRSRTVRQILAYIIVNSRAHGWIVNGPAACLGFSPYCGLWALLETRPTDSKYQELLQNIRKNF